MTNRYSYLVICNIKCSPNSKFDRMMMVSLNLAGIYLFKASMEIPEKCVKSDVFNVNFEQISFIYDVFIIDFEQVNTGWKMIL